MQYNLQQFVKSTDPIKSPAQLAKIIQAIMRSEDENDKHKEHLFGIGLSASYQVQYIELISLGTLDSTLVNKQDVLTFAVQKRCPYFILAHNHNGDLIEPSEEDIKVTMSIGVAGHLVDVILADHLIVNEDSFVSMAQLGLIHEYANVYKTIEDVTEQESFRLVKESLERLKNLKSKSE